MSSSLESFIKLPDGYTVKYSNRDSIIMHDGKQIGEFRFAGETNYGGKKYFTTSTIWLDKEHRRKGIYAAMIQGARDYAKSVGLNGIISYKYDIDTDEFERSADANAFWDNQVNKGKAKKIVDKIGDVYIMENMNLKLRIQKRLMESRLVEAKNKTIDASAIEDGETYFIKGTQKYFSKDEKKWYLENTMGDTITTVEADNFKDAMSKFAAEGWLRKDSDYSTRIELFESKRVNESVVESGEQGGISDSVWKVDFLQKYVNGIDTPRGYVGEYERTTENDKLLENTLKAEGFNDTMVAAFLISISGRNLGGRFSAEDIKKLIPSFIDHNFDKPKSKDWKTNQNDHHFFKYFNESIIVGPDRSNPINEDAESMDSAVAEKLATDLKEALLAFVPETNMLEVYVSKMLMTTVQVRFAKGKDKTVWQNGYIENDPVNLRLVILAQGDKFKMETAGIGYQLKKVGIAPITGKTGTRDQIIAHIVKWFSSNIDMINKPGLLN